MMVRANFISISFLSGLSRQAKNQKCGGKSRTQKTLYYIPAGKARIFPRFGEKREAQGQSWAMASISTSTSLGRRATWTAERAG